MYPSLRFWDDSPRAFVTPALGFGAFIQYKKASFIAPIYYNSPKTAGYSVMTLPTNLSS